MINICILDVEKALCYNVKIVEEKRHMTCLVLRPSQVNWKYVSEHIFQDATTKI